MGGRPRAQGGDRSWGPCSIGFLRERFRFCRQNNRNWHENVVFPLFWVESGQRGKPCSWHGPRQISDGNLGEPLSCNCYSWTRKAPLPRRRRVVLPSTVCKCSLGFMSSAVTSETSPSRCNVSAISRLTGIPRETVRRRTKSLYEAGVLILEGKTYRIAPAFGELLASVCDALTKPVASKST